MRSYGHCRWGDADSQCTPPPEGRRRLTPRADARDKSAVGDVRRGRTRMTRYAVAGLEEIEELTDGRDPLRPARHHFGITSFGVNAWTAREAGDRITNEHDESDPDSDEELYLVMRGRAMFELDGDRVAAPTGTLVFAPPGVKRTAFTEEPETTVIALGGTPGKAYEPDGWEL